MGRQPKHTAQACLAGQNRAGDGGGPRPGRDHAAREDVEAHGLALAGALPRRGCFGPQARQDPAVAGAAIATGNAAEGDRQDGAGQPAQRHPLEPVLDG